MRGARWPIQSPPFGLSFVGLGVEKVPGDGQDDGGSLIVVRPTKRRPAEMDRVSSCCSRMIRPTIGLMCVDFGHFPLVGTGSWTEVWP
jgi:hypothetical protein